MASKEDEITLDDDQLDQKHDDLDLDLDEGEDDQGGKDEDVDEDDEDNKPVTKAFLKDFKKDLLNSIAPALRHANKGSKTNYQQRPTKDTKGNENAPVETLARRMDMKDFSDEHGLSKKQTVEIMKAFGGRLPTRQEVRNPVIKAAIDGIKQSSEVDDNIPSGGSPRNIVIGDKAWDKMDDKEKQRNFGAYQKSLES